MIMSLDEIFPWRLSSTPICAMVFFFCLMGNVWAHTVANRTVLYRSFSSYLMPALQKMGYAYNFVFRSLILNICVMDKPVI